MRLFFGYIASLKIQVNYNFAVSSYTLLVVFVTVYVDCPPSFHHFWTSDSTGWCMELNYFISSTYLISMQVNVRCACSTLKKEWVCQDVLKEYRRSGRDPKEVPKGQFGVGLIPCGGDCAKKVKVSDPELHLRKVQEIKVPDPTIITVFFNQRTVLISEGFTTKQLDFEVMD
jgi:hypothetical protein